ncbi:MAG: hypothetical protein R2831_05520 [Chitinophagaceae bacterium]
MSLEAQNIPEIINIYNETLYIDFSSNVANTIVKGEKEAQVSVFVLTKDFNQEAELFLEKMLQACQLSKATYKIVVLEMEAYALANYRQYKSDINLFFGFSLENDVFAMKRAYNKPFRFNEKKWLISQSLAELMQNVNLKSELWVHGLKVLFSI